MGYFLRNLSPHTGTPTRRGRATLTAASLVGATALLAGLLSTPMASAAPASIDSIVPSAAAVKADVKKFKSGLYIVTMKNAPAATYTGGVSGLAKTKVTGKQLDAKSSAVTKYSSYLKSAQTSLAKKVGAKIGYNYTIALNGFSAKLTSTQAAQLAKSSSVIAVSPVEVLHPTAQRSVDYLGITGADGTWDQLGGMANAGAGVVIGDLDTGIAPENPSFAGETLGTTPGTTPADDPWLDGDGNINYIKSDGSTFTSTPVTTADEWNAADYSTKIIAGQYFEEGPESAYGIGGHDLGEYLSPRDGDGHGSHTASTAAGKPVEDATVEGVNFGDIVGVAPEAKIAAYKVCWTGPYDFTDVDDGCFNNDLIAAVEAAVTDGVDVINFSIGGGSATTVFDPLDQAFFNAAAAGIFISASAGNSGPGASTADHASPWYTTVAASTIPDYEGTVELGDSAGTFAGATVTVDGSLSGELVDASTIAKVNTPTGITAATLCGPDTLNEAAAAGKIVLCDRGNYDRVAKSLEVADAGGIGMVLVNVPGGADDVDNDFHSVPTVHIHSDAHEAVHAYAQTDGATVTLLDVNTVSPTPVPQLADFSSHGPELAAGADILKPDISAPGVSILADGANSDTEDPTFQFLSGTSMAAPHITGLAALYLSSNPLATPAEIKSAMMTTATPILNADGDEAKDVFGEGAGNVHPTTFLDPGLVYLSNEADWKKYLVGTGEVTTATEGFAGVTAIDPSDLNVPSIAIGTLLGSQTVTRKVTVQTAGTYTSSIDGLAGMGATVTPSAFTAAEGDVVTFTVSFNRSTAPLDEWSTGYLTWTGPAVAKIPVALYPPTVVAPAAISGTGTTSSTPITVTGGFNGSVPVTVTGLTQGDKSVNPTDPTLPYTDTIAAGDQKVYSHVVGAGASQVEFDLLAVDAPPGADLDLELWYRATSADAFEDTEIDMGITGAASEKIVIDDPPAGEYQTRVDGYVTPGGSTKFKDIAWVYNAALYKGSPVVVPSIVPVTIGHESTFSVEYTDLAPFTEYRGIVKYGTTGIQTNLNITTTAATTLTNTALPTITGAASVGSTVVASKGTWSLPDSRLAYAYQWNADGAAIPGATNSSFVIPSVLLGKSLTVTVTAKVGALSTAAVSAAAVVGGSNGGTTLTATVAPKITGDETVGDTLTATSGTWNVPTSDLTFTYQWLSNGTPIAGATSSKYKLPSSSYKKKISALVTATLSPGVAMSVPTNAVTVDAKATTSIKLVDSTITTKQKAKVKVTVSASNGASETGKVIVYYDKKHKTVTLKKSDHGKITVTLPKLKKGTYTVYAKYEGTSSIDSDNSSKKTLKVRKA